MIFALPRDMGGARCFTTPVQFECTSTLPMKSPLQPSQNNYWTIQNGLHISEPSKMDRRWKWTAEFTFVHRQKNKMP